MAQASGLTPNQKAVAQLLNVADRMSKTVLSAYNPNVPFATNVSKMSSSKFNLETLERCANFLNIPTQDSDGVALFSNKGVIAQRITYAIEALFEAPCDECNQDYSPVFDPPEAEEEKEEEEENGPPKVVEEAPKVDVKANTLDCFRCFRPSHNCEQLKAKIEKLEGLPTGFVWLCSGCKTMLNPITPPKRKRLNTGGSTVINSAVNTPKGPGSITPVVTGDMTRKGGLDTDLLKSALTQVSQHQQDTESSDKTLLKFHNQDTATTTRNCSQYLGTRNCPHGRNGDILIDGKACAFLHPKLCRRYCSDGTNNRYGCTRGRKCMYYHPKLCRNSLQKLHCSVDNCKFTHLRGTYRGHQERPEKKKTFDDRGYNLFDDRPKNTPSYTNRRYEERERNSNNRRYQERTEKPIDEQEISGRRSRAVSFNEEKQAEPPARPPPTETPTTVKPIEDTTPSNNQFLQMMGLVTTMQEDFKREITNMKIALNNVSLATQHPAEKVNISSQYMPTPAPMLNMTSYPMLTSQPGPGYQQHCY
jgi:hypothetical protein